MRITGEPNVHSRYHTPENELCYLAMLLFPRYIKETNTKNDPNQLNNLIKKSCEVTTWTPRPGATLDLGRMLKDPTDRYGG